MTEQIARSVSDFSREGVNMPVVTLEATSKKYQASIPREFITFYQSIISFISQYQSAFEEENFNRMAQFVVAVNDAIVKYFKSSTELKDELNGIAQDTAVAAKELLKKKAEKSFSEEELKSQVLEIVSSYKEKILSKVKALVVLARNGAEASGSAASSSSKKEAAGLISKTVSSANEILKKEEIEYKAEIEKFSIRLGTTIIKEFKDSARKLSEYNLRTFEKGVNRLSTAYANHFYNIVNTANASISKSQGKLKAGLSKIGKVLKYSAITMVNTVSLTIAGFTYAYLGGKLFVKTLWFWGGKVLAPVKYLLGLGLKLTRGAITLAFKAVKIAVAGVYAAGKFLIKTSARVLNKIQVIAGKIWKAVFGFSFWGFVKGTFSAFVFSYPGAYFLGYVSGKIWGGILRLAGLSADDIKNGNYHIKDDVLMPFFEMVRGKILGVFGEGSAFSKWEDGLKNGAKNVLEELKKTKIWQQISKLKENVDFKKMRDKIVEFVGKTKELYDDYISPVVSVAASLLSVFTAGMIESPKTFFRARTGAMFGLVEKSAFFAKHVKLRGGIAGLLASAITIGVGMLLGMSGGNKKKGNLRKNKDADSPISMDIEKQNQGIFGQGEEDLTGEYEGYKPRIVQLHDILKKFSDKAHSTEDESERELARSKYEQIKSTVSSLLSERSSMSGIMESIDKLLEKYKEENQIVGNPNDLKWKASDYAFTDDVLSYNGEYLFSPHALDSLDALTQMSVLADIAKQRHELARRGIEEIKALGEDFDIKSFDPSKYYGARLQIDRIDVDRRFVSGQGAINKATLKLGTAPLSDRRAYEDIVAAKIPELISGYGKQLSLARSTISGGWGLDEGFNAISSIPTNELQSILNRMGVKTIDEIAKKAGIDLDLALNPIDGKEKIANKAAIQNMLANEENRRAFFEAMLQSGRAGELAKLLEGTEYSKAMLEFRRIAELEASAQSVGKGKHQFGVSLSIAFQKTIDLLKNIVNGFTETFLDHISSVGLFGDRNIYAIGYLRARMPKHVNAVFANELTTESRLKEFLDEDGSLINVGYRIFERSLQSLIDDFMNSDESLKEIASTLQTMKDSGELQQSLVSEYSRKFSESNAEADKAFQEAARYIDKISKQEKISE